MQKFKIPVGLLVLLSAAFLLSAFGKPYLSGETKTEPLLRISSPDADSAEPSLASAPGGGVYLIWVEHRQDGSADVFLQKIDSVRKPIGEKVRVNPQIGQATAWRGDPPTVKVGVDNTIYVGWTARVKSDEGTANDLYLSVSHNGGQTFDAPVKVNDDKIPAVHGMHSLAIDKNNNVYFSWLDDRYLKHEAQKQQAKAENKMEAEGTQPPHHHMESNREVYFAVSKNGGRSFEANKQLASDACPCCKISMLIASDGKIYVSWRQVLPNNYRHIALASSNNGGKTFTAAVIVSDDKWQLDGCPVSGASLAVGADNSLKIIWYSAGDTGKTGLYRAESKDGKTFSPRSLLYEGVLTGTPLILANANKDYKIVWQSNGKVWQLTTQLTTDDNDKIEEIGVGKMPAGAIDGEKLFVGFIQSEGDKRSIWLY